VIYTAQTSDENVGALGGKSRLKAMSLEVTSKTWAAPGFLR